MLAHFSLLGVFFSLLACSCTLLEHFLLMLVVFFGFLVALDWILHGLGLVLEPSKLHFSIFLLLASTHHWNALRATKPQFLRCFIDFGKCRTQLPLVFFAWLWKLCWTWCAECCKKSLLAFTLCFSKPPCSAAVRAQHMEFKVRPSPKYPSFAWDSTLLRSSDLSSDLSMAR